MCHSVCTTIYSACLLLAQTRCTVCLVHYSCKFNTAACFNVTVHAMKLLIWNVSTSWYMSIVHELYMSIDASPCPSCVHILLVFVCSGTRSGEPSHAVCRLFSVGVCAPCTCCMHVRIWQANTGSHWLCVHTCYEELAVWWCMATSRRRTIHNQKFTYKKSLESNMLSAHTSLQLAIQMHKPAPFNIRQGQYQLTPDGLKRAHTRM